VRLSYPLNDTPLLTLRGISVAHYYSATRTAAERRRAVFVAGTIVIVWLTFWFLFGLFAAGFYGLALAALLRLDPILLVFILGPMVFPIYYAIGYAPPRWNSHYFYKDWARVYDGRGRNPYTPFFAEGVESFQFKKAAFKGGTACLMTVRFKPMKPQILGRRDNVEFVICDEDQASIRGLEEWVRGLGIEIVVQSSDNHRRS
jgi:hypothetical protein